VSFAVGSRLVVVWKHDPMPSPHLAATDDPGTAYLVERINLVADRLAAVAGAGDDADALDVELGRIADAVAELDRKAEKAEQAKRSAASIPTRSVAAAFGLAPAEVDVILLSALVDLDPDARGRCAAFHGSTDAVRPTIGLALACLGASVDHRSAMGYFGEASPLVRHHLVAIEAFDRPLTARAYSVPDRVVRALWGSTQVDPLLRNLQAPLVGVASDEATAVADAIRAGIRSIYVRERPLASGLAFASGRAAGGRGAVRGRLGDRQDAVGRGDRRRPRARPVRHRPVDGGRQVHRRDREEPRPDLRRGRGRQRRAVLRRGRRAVRQALRGLRRPDRYANVEVAYLLQRMERFDGVAILATNLRSNVDEAFTRRLDAIVDFPLPDVDHRRHLWEHHLPERCPGRRHRRRVPGVARSSSSGGEIRNIAVTAAYLAAQRGAEVTMGDLVRAMSAEYSKMGRLFDTSVLGRHARSLDDDLLP
jgi:SpoVK/Ycf46/Vps4 family AAA+-type ATPase